MGELCIEYNNGLQGISNHVNSKLISIIQPKILTLLNSLSQLQEIIPTLLTNLETEQSVLFLEKCNTSKYLSVINDVPNSLISESVISRSCPLLSSNHGMYQK